jgi:DnaK suppressor protein
MAQSDETRRTRLQNLLIREKRRLWNELRVELFDTLGVDLNRQFDIPQDIGDRGVLDLLGDTGLAIADIRREQLTQIDAALARLETGSYGICEDCGTEIDESRLSVSPYAACCVACQFQRETPGKRAAQY